MFGGNGHGTRKPCRILTEHYFDVHAGSQKKKMASGTDDSDGGKNITSHFFSHIKIRQTRLVGSSTPGEKLY